MRVVGWFALGAVPMVVAGALLFARMSRIGLKQASDFCSFVHLVFPRCK